MVILVNSGAILRCEVQNTIRCLQLHLPASCQNSFHALSSPEFYNQAVGAVFLLVFSDELLVRLQAGLASSTVSYRQILWRRQRDLGLLACFIMTTVAALRTILTIFIGS